MSCCVHLYGSTSSDIKVLTCGKFIRKKKMFLFMSFFIPKHKCGYTQINFSENIAFILSYMKVVCICVCYTESILTLNWKLKLIENRNRIHFNGDWSKISFNCHGHMYIVLIAYSHFVDYHWPILRDKHAMDRLNDLSIKIIFYVSILNFSSTKYFLTSKFPGGYLLFSEVWTLLC